jgi:hypothetical protein
LLTGSAGWNTHLDAAVAFAGLLLAVEVGRGCEGNEECGGTGQDEEPSHLPPSLKLVGL